MYVPPLLLSAFHWLLLCFALGVSPWIVVQRMNELVNPSRRFLLILLLREHFTLWVFWHCAGDIGCLKLLHREQGLFLVGLQGLKTQGAGFLISADAFREGPAVLKHFFLFFLYTLGLLLSWMLNCAFSKGFLWYFYSVLIHSMGVGTTRISHLIQWGSRRPVKLF